MTLIEGLTEFKTKYKPRDEYSIMLFITTYNVYYAAVFRKEGIQSKKGDMYIAELSINNIKAGSYIELVERLRNYIIEI